MAKLNNVKILQVIKVHKSDVTCLEFWGNVLLVSGSSDKTVRIWKWIVGSGFVEDSKSPYIGHKYGVTSVKISPHGSVLASSSIDGTIILWDLEEGIITNILHQMNGEAVRSCTFSPDGTVLAAADDTGSVCLWDQNKHFLKCFRYHEDTIYTLAFSPDSCVLLTGCSSGLIRLTKIQTEATQYECGIDSAHDLGITSADFCKLIFKDPIDFNASIYTLATCGVDNTIKIWRIFNLTEPVHEKYRSRLIPKIGEHQSGTSLVYNKSTINAECVMDILAHGSSLTCVRFNHRGTMLLSCSLDKTIKLWDLQGNLLTTLFGHTRYVNCVALNEDSTILVSGSNDRRILIWDLTSSLTLDSRLEGLRSLVFESFAIKQTEIPIQYLCPISHEIMKHPVLVDDGYNYEKSVITDWFSKLGKSTSPMTNTQLKNFILLHNFDLKRKIENFLKSIDFDSYVT